MNCPGCQSPTVEKHFEGIARAGIPLDVCHACHGLWFDKTENLRLSPTGVLRLFRELHAPHSGERPSLLQDMACPRCRSALARTYDLAHNNRFHYFRCPQGHGHFIPFFQFLREKGIVRTLTPRERNELKQRMPTVQCSHCAEPVDLTARADCARCQTPVSVLDASGVEALLQKQQPEARRRALAAASSGLAVEASRPSSSGSSVAEDLVELGFEVLLEGLGSFIDF
jgi:endogenous inhibitor of DNA gyrase (YacG/DUF329 family)